MSFPNLIPVQEVEKWRVVLSQCGEYSIYHMPQYSLLAQSQGEGDPYLFYFQNEDGVAAIPFLLRSISSVPGLESISYRDATSVYGYPGIICSVPKHHPKAKLFREEFQKYFFKILHSLDVVDFFSRLNPLISTSWLFENFGEVIPLSPTVAIDLTLPDQEQVRNISKGHRYDLRKARAAGVTVREDKDFNHLDDFVRIYQATMARTNAKEYYFFSKEYFRKLKPLFGDAIRMFLAEKDQRIVSASLFFTAQKIIQYHLSGTPEDCISSNGAKMILDEVRVWGKEHGFEWLHLGGGVGSREDSLFRFKAGFSKLRFTFEIVKIILHQNVYQEIIRKHDSIIMSRMMRRKPGEYFPDYRAPIESIVL